jgi:hypothetical protein
MVTALFIMGKRGRGRPKKIKKLEQYTISELRDMPMGPFLRLFLGDLTGGKATISESTNNTGVIFSTPEKKKDSKTQESHLSDTSIKMESTISADMMGMTLEKKADYLADALMRYLKKSR